MMAERRIGHIDLKLVPSQFLALAQATNQPKFRLYAETPTRFSPLEFPANIEFIKDAGGKISSIILDQDGQQHEAKRITP